MGGKEEGEALSGACWLAAVNGNPTLLDLGGIPSILQINANASLELRDLLIKNVATRSSLKNASRTALARLTLVSGMLTWPSFFAQPGANLRIYNTTQYYWSETLYRRPDCKWDAQPSDVPPDEEVCFSPCCQAPLVCPASGHCACVPACCCGELLARARPAARHRIERLHLPCMLPLVMVSEGKFAGLTEG